MLPVAVIAVTQHSGTGRTKNVIGTLEPKVWQTVLAGDGHQTVSAGVSAFLSQCQPLAHEIENECLECISRDGWIHVVAVSGRRHFKSARLSATNYCGSWVRMLALIAPRLELSGDKHAKQSWVALSTRILLPMCTWEAVLCSDVVNGHTFVIHSDWPFPNTQ